MQISANSTGTTTTTIPNTISPMTEGDVSFVGLKVPSVLSLGMAVSIVGVVVGCTEVLFVPLVGAIEG